MKVALSHFALLALFSTSLVAATNETTLRGGNKKVIGNRRLKKSKSSSSSGPDDEAREETGMTQEESSKDKKSRDKKGKDKKKSGGGNDPSAAISQISGILDQWAGLNVLGTGTWTPPSSLGSGSNGELSKEDEGSSTTTGTQAPPTPAASPTNPPPTNPPPTNPSPTNPPPTNPPPTNPPPTNPPPTNPPPTNPPPTSPQFSSSFGSCDGNVPSVSGKDDPTSPTFGCASSCDCAESCCVRYSVSNFCAPPHPDKPGRADVGGGYLSCMALPSQ